MTVKEFRIRWYIELVKSCLKRNDETSHIEALKWIDETRFALRQL